MSVNKVILIGRLGQDPELKYTQAGKAVASFSVATSESYKGADGVKKESTEWHRIKVWGKLGELCGQYLKKGRECFIEGKLTTSSWEDKNGQKRYMTEVSATTVQFLGGKAEASQDATQNQNYNIETNASFATDDIPF